MDSDIWCRKEGFHVWLKMGNMAFLNFFPVFKLMEGKLSSYAYLCAVAYMKTLQNPTKLFACINHWFALVSLDDVVYVIDSGLMKEKNFSIESNADTLDCTCISQVCMLVCICAASVALWISPTFPESAVFLRVCVSPGYLWQPGGF